MEAGAFSGPAADGGGPWAVRPAPASTPAAAAPVDYRAVFAAAPGLFLLIAPDLTILDASDAYLRATHTRRDQIRGRNLFDVFPADPFDAAPGAHDLRRSIDSVLRTGAADTMATVRYPLRRPAEQGGGFEERYWSPVNAPVLDPHTGAVRWIVHRVEDVTEFVLRHRRAALSGKAGREATATATAAATEDLRSALHRAEAELLRTGQDLRRANEDLRRLYEPARRRAAELDAVIEALPEAAYVGTADGITTANATALRMLGASSLADLRDRIGELARKFNVRWAADGRPVAPDDLVFARALRGEPSSAEVLVTRADTGRDVYVLSRSAPVVVDGQIIGAVAINTDISERVEIERQLRRARDAAEAANRAKDEFLAVLSHELRTPLTPVLTTVQMLEADPSLSAEVRDALAVVRRNIGLEARLIDDLLDLTRIVRGKLGLQPAQTDLHLKLSCALAICDGDVRAKGLTLETDFRATRYHMRADPARVEQVFWNLLKNAVKFTPAGGSVRVRTRDAGYDRVQIVVEDTGVGIAADALPKLFDAFEQGSAEVTRQFGGLGLGLAISKALVDAHGGTLTAASDGPGTGAAFTVTFPVDPATTGDATARAAADANAAQAHGRILVVEDHADTAYVMARLLRRLGYTVRTAGSVAEALREVAAEPFDLVISDIGLPDGSGLDLMAQVRAIRDVPGIALSGFGMEQDVARSLAAGFEQHLTKPVDLFRLEAAVGRAIGQQGGESPGGR